MPIHTSTQRKIIIPLIILAAIAIVFGIISNSYQTKINKLEQRIADLEKQSTSATNPESPDQGTPEPLTPTNVYTNTTYHYSLQYPRNLQIQKMNEEMANIGIFDSSLGTDYMAGKIGLAVRTGEKTENYLENIEKISFDLINGLCDADGRGASISCPRKKSFQALTLPSGLTAYTLTVEEETRTLVPEKSITTDDKVFYVIDLTTDKVPTLLAIYSIGDGTDELAKQIAETVTEAK